MAFDPQGETLASGSGDKTVKLWETRSGKLLRTLEGHTDSVNAVVFSPDGHLLASKSNDHTIRLWSCETWETVAVIPSAREQRTLALPALAFHPTLPLLAAAARRANPRRSTSGSWTSLCCWASARSGGGRARGPSHDRQDRAGGRSQRGQIGAGLSPDPRRFQGAGFDARAAVLGVSRPWQTPRGRDGLRGDPLGFRGPARLPAGPRAFRGQRRPGAGVVRCLGPPRPAARRRLLAQATPSGPKSLPHHPRGRSDGSRDLVADAGGTERVLPEARHRGSDRDQRLNGRGRSRNWSSG